MKVSAFRILALAAIAHPALAADLDVVVRGANGAPVRDAVVSVRLAGQPTPHPRPAGPYAVDQQDLQFHPFVMVVPVGAEVVFMNHDPVRHHVYSFSPAKSFQLKLEKREQNRTVRFDKPGVVPLGCNIHDAMIAYVSVVDTPWARTTDASGHVVLRNVSEGGVIVTVWHPYLRSPGNAVTRTVPLSDSAMRREQFAVVLRSPPRQPEASY